VYGHLVVVYDPEGVDVHDVVVTFMLPGQVGELFGLSSPQFISGVNEKPVRAFWIRRSSECTPAVCA
jgi:hypothetical protein